MTAREIAVALGGRRVGSCWMARCPTHEDRTPSLSLRDAGGRVLIKCHAGCPQRAVIAALRDRGLWPGGGGSGNGEAVGVPVAALPPPRHDANDPARRDVALTLWRATSPGAGSPVETYLASRGILWPVPGRLRFHPGLKHLSGGIWPAMVGLVTRGADDEPIGFHRSFIARDGCGKAPVTPAKMMLGPCHGGAVRLASAGDSLMLGEGLETCLAAMQAIGLPAWAALSTSGLRALELPATVREVIVLADGDDQGEAAARDCARRWASEGRRVRIARPPRGQDFNDMLTAAGEGA